MSQKTLFRVAAVAAALSVPVLLAGCALSRDMRLANMGFAYVEKDQLVDAEATLKKALEANPDNPYAILNMGAVYQRTGRFDQARVMFEKVVALNPKDTPSRRSKSANRSWTLKEIAENNLKCRQP